MRDMRIKNINRLIIGHLTVNKIDIKFESLKNIIQGNLDMFVLSETKLDDSYPTHEFNVESYHLPFRHDRNAYGGGILIYVKEGISCKQLKNRYNPKEFERNFPEINLKKSKCYLEVIITRTQTSRCVCIYVCIMYVCMYVCMYNVCMYV